jgi:hypothetical protein
MSTSRATWSCAGVLLSLGLGGAERGAEVAERSRNGCCVGLTTYLGGTKIFERHDRFCKWEQP